MMRQGCLGVPAAVMMRQGCLDIVAGWMMVDDFEDLTDRIERAAEWAAANGPLTGDESATVALMIKSQIARAIRRGDFEPFIPSDASDADIAVLVS
jgi:hypothetical protein